MTHGSLVSAEQRASVRARVEPIARMFGRVGLTPNALTVIGLLIAGVAAVAAAYQLWLAAGLLVIFGGVFDMFDGALARATGTTSRFGAFLDSTLDRAGEGVVYLGVIAGLGAAGIANGAILAAAAMAAAFMVSYTRAKSEGLGYAPGSGMANVGVAPREVRIAILTFGLIASGLVGGPSNNAWLQLSLGAITLLATITTIQRIVAVRRQASSEDIR